MKFCTPKQFLCVGFENEVHFCKFCNYDPPPPPQKGKKGKRPNFCFFIDFADLDQTDHSLLKYTLSPPFNPQPCPTH